MGVPLTLGIRIKGWELLVKYKCPSSVWRAQVSSRFVTNPYLEIRRLFFFGVNPMTITLRNNAKMVSMPLAAHKRF